jgi:hypothetical protein
MVFACNHCIDNKLVHGLTGVEKRFGAVGTMQEQAKKHNLRLINEQPVFNILAAKQIVFPHPVKYPL